MQGTFCAVPISVNMAYKQLADDAAGEDPGVRLIRLWFDTPAANGGPWRTIRAFSSDQLGFECVQGSYDDVAVTVFLDGAVGLNAQPATPSPFCLQMNIPAANPHPAANEGRFFWPGLTMDQVERAGVTSVFSQEVRRWALSLLEIDDLGGGQGPRYALMPHAGYLDRAGQTDDVLAFVPYANLMVKVLGTRKSDACQAFVAGANQGGFAPITIPEGEPAIAILAPPNNFNQSVSVAFDWDAQIDNFTPTSVNMQDDTTFGQGNVLALADQGSGLWRTNANSTWLGVGTHTYYAVAIDAQGAQIVSDPRTIIVAA